MSLQRLYNKRCSAKQWIKQGKHAMKKLMMWLSCHGFRSKEVGPRLSVLVYDQGEPVSAPGAAHLELLGFPH